MNKEIEEAVVAYLNKEFEYSQFLAGVSFFFEKHPILNKKPFPIIHSIKSRLKDPTHLAEKLERKLEEGRKITKENIFTEITDFSGVRVLHLYQDQFPEINAAIQAKVSSGDWVFGENPKAYTWDPESAKFYKDQNIETEVRETYYTSIHYLVKPNNQNTVCCEIQVRTLFEEIWGEIDHTINYPRATNSLSCKEQLRVLAKLVSTGTRLADSISRTHNEYKGLSNDGSLSPNIAIHSARYGLKDKPSMDVTKKLSDHINNDIYEIKISNDLVDGYDLYHGDQKLLEIDFTVNGNRKQISGLEGDSIKFE